MCNFGYERNQMRERVKFAAEACGLMGMLDRSPLSFIRRPAAAGCGQYPGITAQGYHFDESTSQLDQLDGMKYSVWWGSCTGWAKRSLWWITISRKIADTVDKVVVLHEGELVAYDEPHIVFGNKNLFKRAFRTCTTGDGCCNCTA